MHCPVFAIDFQLSWGAESIKRTDYLASHVFFHGFHDTVPHVEEGFTSMHSSLQQRGCL